MNIISEFSTGEFIGFGILGLILLGVLFSIIRAIILNIRDNFTCSDPAIPKYRIIEKRGKLNDETVYYLEELKGGPRTNPRYEYVNGFSTYEEADERLKYYAQDYTYTIKKTI